MGQGCVITLAQSDVFEGVSLRITAVAMHRLPFLAQVALFGTDEGQ